MVASLGDLWLWPFHHLLVAILVFIVMLGVERVVGDPLFFYENWKYEATTYKPILEGGNFYLFGFVGNSTSISLSIYHEIDEDNDVLFWTAGNNQKLYSNANLVARKDQSGFILELHNGIGNVVWKSNIEGIVAMELQEESGNLVFYDNTSSVIWDSFSHPTNTLVKTQRILQSTTLSSNSGLYSTTLYKGGLVSFVNVPDPLPYWFCSLNQSFDNGNSSFDKRDIGVVFLPPCSGGSDFVMELPSAENQSMPGFTLSSSPCGSVKLAFYVGPNLLPADYMVLNDDGYFKGYSLLQGNSIVPLERTIPGGVISFPFSPISNYIREPLYPCDVPNPCYPYGICTPGPQLSCTCPSSLLDNPTASKVFQQLNPQNPSQSCLLTLDPSSPSYCNNSNNIKPTFLEVKNTTFISLLVLGWNYTKVSLVDCLALCESNCSCIAIFYQHNTSMCLPVGKVLSLLNMSDSNYSSYLKVYLPSSSSSNRLVLPLAISLPTVFMLMICAIGLWRHFPLIVKDPIDVNMEEDDEELQQIAMNLPTKFSYNELDMATEAFTRRLGVGGFGSVYEGDLVDGRRVAVKKLENISMRGHGQGRKEFLAEVATIGRVDHINIIHLLGFCLENSNRMLVYECMEKGSLDKWLYPTNHQCFLLDWETRLNVALGVARGLAYLHEECSEPILHLDVKPQNILLDTNFVPKLSDFGMSRPIDRDSSRVMTKARGTPGYMAPELIYFSTVTRGCDVYSFGIVLLEIVAGRRPLNINRGQEEEEDWYLPSWASCIIEQGRVANIIDKRLEGAYNVDEAVTLIKTAFWCIHEDPSKRPTMGLVVKMLQQQGFNGDNLEYPPLTFKRFPFIPKQFAIEIDVSSSCPPLPDQYSSWAFSAR